MYEQLGKTLRKKVETQTLPESLPHRCSICSQKFNGKKENSIFLILNSLLLLWFLARCCIIKPLLQSLMGRASVEVV